MMAPQNLLYYRAKFGRNRTTHVGVRGQSVMFSLFCLSRCRQSTASVLIGASTFVGQLSRGLQLLFGKKSPFSGWNRFENRR